MKTKRDQIFDSVLALTKHTIVSQHTESHWRQFFQTVRENIPSMWPLQVLQVLETYRRSRIFHVLKISRDLFLPPGKEAKIFNGVQLELRAHAREVSKLRSVKNLRLVLLDNWRVCSTAFQMESCVRRYLIRHSHTYAYVRTLLAHRRKISHA